MTPSKSQAISQPAFNYKLLTLLLSLFCLRVVGQIVVAIWHPDFLPPMEEWFSGLMSYPPLLCCQILIIALFSKVIFDLRNSHGYFAKSHHRLGIFLRYFGLIYLTTMLLRYALRMSLYANERWMGGSIPIIFHCVLATYLIIWGHNYSQRSKPREISKKSRIAKVGQCLVVVSTCLSISIWVGWQTLPSAIASLSGIRSPRYAVRIESNVPLAMSDGHLIVANIFHPNHLKYTPTALRQLPFSTDIKSAVLESVICRMWSERGYTVVVQRSDKNDEKRIVEWLRKASWFNGKLFEWDGSSSEPTQLLLSDSNVQNEPSTTYAREKSVEK